MSRKIPSEEDCIQVAAVLKNLSHPRRLMILCQLTDGPKTVGELKELSGASQSAVSQFLARMKAEGLVYSERENQFIYYDIKDSRIKKLIQSLEHIFCS